MRYYNRPMDYVHDAFESFAYLLLPWRGGWVAWSRRRRRFVRVTRFHNCTATGRY